MVRKFFLPLLKFYLGFLTFENFLKAVCNNYNIQYQEREPNQLQPQQGTLIIANHRSVLDPLILMNHVQQLGMLKGQGVSKAKWYARIFWFFVHRSNRDVQVSYLGDSGVFRRWIRCLRSKQNVLFFPEGTRNVSDQPLLKFQPGAEKLIQAAKAGLLMYYIPASEVTLEKGSADIPVEYKYFRFEEIHEDVESLYRKTFNL